MVDTATAAPPVGTRRNINRPAVIKPAREPSNVITAEQIKALAADVLLDLPTEALCMMHHVSPGTVARVRDGTHALLTTEDQVALEWAETSADIVTKPPNREVEMPAVELAAAPKQSPLKGRKRKMLPKETVVAIANEILAGHLKFGEIAEKFSVSHGVLTSVSKGEHRGLPGQMRMKLRAHHRSRSVRGNKASRRPAAPMPIPLEPAPKVQPQHAAASKSPRAAAAPATADDVAYLKQMYVDSMLEVFKLRQRLAQYEPTTAA